MSSTVIMGVSAIYAVMIAHLCQYPLKGIFECRTSLVLYSSDDVVTPQHGLV